MGYIKKEYRSLSNVKVDQSKQVAFLIHDDFPVTSSEIRFIIGNVDLIARKKKDIKSEEDKEAYEKLMEYIKKLDQYYKNKKRIDEIEAKKLELTIKNEDIIL